MPFFEPGAQTEDERIAVQAWNLMDGSIDWAGLPVIAEMYGVVDIESMIARLGAIRVHVRRKADE